MSMIFYLFNIVTIKNLPTTIGETVTYNFRNNDDYRTQRCRLQTSSNSFFPSTIKLWNSLPDSVKFLLTFSKLKIR
jgi:hypothetical protein